MIYAAWAIFLISYTVFAFGRLPGTKLDRAGMAFIGAALMFAIGAIDGRHAVASLDFETLVLLFSMMVLVAVLHLDGFFKWITAAIVERFEHHHLLPGVIFTSGILSAFLVNDVVCLFLAPLVLRICKHMGRNPVPFLLALAMASNIGSAATITGNPQNILIGSVSGVAYRDFLFHLGPVAAVGLFIEWGIVSLVWRKELSERRPAEPEVEHPHARLGALPGPLLVLVGIVVAFLAGANPALVAAIGAAVLMVMRSRNLRLIYREIDWPLLVMFAGLFVIIGAAQQTGIASSLLGTAHSWNMHNIAIFSAGVTLLSNVVSNVPAVMLVKEMIPQFANQHQMWLALAAASTLAGNLTITGSIANFIVVERVKSEVHISFRDYLRAGLPTTILTVAIGAVWIAFLVRH